MKIVVGDCVEAMRAMPEASVDAVVTDPPYGLEFMGKEWDKLVAPARGKTAGLEHSQTIEHRNDTPQHRASVKQPAALKRCENCGGNSSGQWNRCMCFMPDFRERSDLKQAMQAWHFAWAREALRVLKPGGHFLAFGGTRTFHRLTCALEDAGFEIRDCLMWLYGSRKGPRGHAIATAGTIQVSTGKLLPPGENLPPYESESEEAKQWSGWGTALKPAWEPIIFARKPLIGPVAENVLAHGTGALNIDVSRINYTSVADQASAIPQGKATAKIGGLAGGQQSDRERNEFTPDNTKGRWPANVLLSHVEGCEKVGMKRVKGSRIEKPSDCATDGVTSFERMRGSRPARGIGDADGMETVEAWRCVEGCPVRMLDEQSGVLKSGDSAGFKGPYKAHIYGKYKNNQINPETVYADSGGASRFFYTSKASGDERYAFCKTCSCKVAPGEDRKHPRSGHDVIRHPTQKPEDLIRYLLKFVLPPGGMVLDLFGGSGTILVAAASLGIDNAVMVERDPDYAMIAQARMASEMPFVNVEVEELKENEGGPA